MLKDNFDCVFYTVEPSDYQVRELQHVCPYVSLSEETKFRAFLDCLDGSEIVLLDNYFYTSDYQKEIKAKGSKLICIDDMHDKHYFADVVINHAYGCHKEDYSVEPYTQLALGLSYALLRRPFLESKNNLNRNHTLICFGGADMYNLTCKVLKALSGALKEYTVDVIAGDAFMAKEELSIIQSQNSNIVIHKAIPAEQMSILMQQAKIAFLSASSVLWEAIFSGCKVIYGYYIDNQMDICRNVGDNEELGLRFIGDLREVTDFELNNAFAEMNYVQKEHYFQKPKVRDNFVNLFKQEVTVREANDTDAKLYFEWANDTVVRQMAFHTEPITWENHLAWFKRKVIADNSLLLVCYQKDEPVGQVRFDLSNNGKAEIDISIANVHRGKGLGKAMLNAAIDYAHNMRGINSFVSEVKNENHPSHRMFLATGFEQTCIENGIHHYSRNLNNLTT